MTGQGGGDTKRAMLGKWGLPGWLKPVLLLLAFAALSVRIIVPAGYMVGRDDANHVVIEMCTSHGTELRVLDLATGQYGDPARPADTPNPENELTPCVFAAGVTFTAPAAPPAEPVLPVIIRTASVQPPASSMQARALAAPPPPQTGPPTLL